jgi:CheY-like chemotaxis protein
MKDLRGLEVLVVDDNATNRRILDEILKSWGMRPTLADGGLAAITALDRALEAGKPFPLAIIDFQMPDIDGFGLAGRIKARPDLAPTMIMMLSSVGNQATASGAESSGSIVSHQTRTAVVAARGGAIRSGDQRAPARAPGCRDAAHNQRGAPIVAHPGCGRQRCESSARDGAAR